MEEEELSLAAAGGEEGDVFSTFVFPCSDEFARRDYQLNIISKSLLKNTLVVLPTGLGKTFIAAVVMYNYLRWFPDKKVIFLAPTRPLVKQQIEACHDVVGIDERETAEMNGQTSQDKRRILWQTRRVFYCTPQTLEKDLYSDSFPRDQISLIVIDEAHRAVGKYAFVTAVEMLFQANPRFRVLALSATPGKDLAKVQEVCTNLLISGIEYKCETDFDVKPYVHNKLLVVEECEMSTASLDIINEFTQLIEVPLCRIRKMNVYQQALPNAKDISKFQAVSMLNAVAAMDNLHTKQIGMLRGEWGLLSALLYIKELFTHGLGAALAYMDTSFEDDKKMYGQRETMVKSSQYQKFKQRLRVAVQAGQGSPKLAKLSSLLTSHFARFHEAGKKTSVIVFAQYRDSVGEICQALKISCPELSVSPFVGQANKSSSATKKLSPSLAKKKRNGEFEEDDDEEEEEEEEEEEQQQPQRNTASNGQKQKEQQEVVRKFRAGEIDVIVATCIGEEGLDIGSVDLIISYDALQSPVRMIQRFGRAGRKRAGHVIVLIANAKERQVFTNGTKMSEKVHRLLRENMWKLKFFVPPDEFCMFPNAKQKPTALFQKLEISKYQAELVGGTKPRKRKEEARDWSVFTDHERTYLNLRFGGDVSAAPVTQQRLSLAQELRQWRFAAHGNLIGTSSRSKVVQSLAKFMATAAEQQQQDSGAVHDEDEDLLNTPYIMGISTPSKSNRDLVTTDDDGGGESNETEDDEVLMLRSERVVKEEEDDDDDLVPEPPSDWDSGQEEKMELPVFGFPTTPEEDRGFVYKIGAISASPQTPKIASPLPVPVKPESVDDDSQSPFVPRSRAFTASTEEVNESSPAAKPRRRIVMSGSQETPRSPQVKRPQRSLVQVSASSVDSSASTPHERAKTRQRIVQRAFISAEADCEDDDEDEEEDSDLDRDLDSFIDDSSQPMEEEEDNNNGTSPVRRKRARINGYRAAQFSKSPVDRIGLMNKSSRVKQHYGNGIIGQALQRLKHRVEHGLSPSSVEEEEEEEEEENERLYSSDDDAFESAPKHVAPKRVKKTDEIVRTLTFEDPAPPVPPARRSCSPNNNVPLVSMPPPQQLQRAPSVTPIARPPPSLITSEVQQQIEMKRQLAFQKLKASQLHSVPRSVASPITIPPPSLISTTATPTPPVAFRAPQSNFTPLVDPNIVTKPPVATTPVVAPPLQAVKPVILYNHANPSSAAVIRSLAQHHQLDPQMCPHVPFFGADCILSCTVSLKLVTAMELLSANQHQLCTWLEQVQQRTSQVLIVVYLADAEQQALYANDSVVQEHVRMIRSKASHVSVAKTAFELSKLLCAFCKREDGHKRRQVFQQAQWRQLLWMSKSHVELLANLPASNVLIALGLLLHYSTRTLWDLCENTDLEMLCTRIAPDLPRAQAVTMLTALRQCKGDEWKSVYISCNL